MALHTDLDIYRDASRLFALMINVAKNMRRDVKQLIGSKLRDECIEILNGVQMANRTTGNDRVTQIDAFLPRLNAIEAILRVSRDEKLVSTGQYADAIRLTQSIGKQAGGWRRKASSSAA